MSGRPPLPSLELLKDQAKRLRAKLAGEGQSLSHAQALEVLAAQHGYRDWNTLYAAAGNRPPACPVQLGQRVEGAYLGQPFAGEVIAARIVSEGRYRLTLAFDEPVDVVTFDSFSAFRSRVNCTIDGAGRTAEKTSDDRPHLVLRLPV